MTEADGMRADEARISSIIGRVTVAPEAQTKLRHAMARLLDIGTAARDSNPDQTENCRSEGRET